MRPSLLRYVAAVTVLGYCLPFAHAQTGSGTAGGQQTSGTQGRLLEGYGRLPMRFEPNGEGNDTSGQFIARGQGYSVLLTSRAAVLSMARPSVATYPPVGGGGRPHIDPFAPNLARARTASAGLAGEPVVLRINWLGVRREATGSAEEQLSGTTNYLLGSDPKKWRTNVATYRKVQYAQIYPGIDLVYYGNQRQLEYDFLVAPGADPRVINFTVEGADHLRLDGDGALLIQTRAGELRFLPPNIYQEMNGTLRQVSGAYVVHAGTHVGFSLAGFDPRSPLVIDPVLVYSTCLGGADSVGGNGTVGQAIAVDKDGNAYLTGYTDAVRFPSSDVSGSTLAGGLDAFVAKLKSDGSELLYVTYLGGSSDDSGQAIAVDDMGSAYLTGYTSSADFPVVNAVQSRFAGGSMDAFVAKLKADGSGLIYSTFLGGRQDEVGLGIAVDAAGEAYVTGYTLSGNFPTVNPLQSSLGGTGTSPTNNADAFVAKLKADGSALWYSTYLGGSGTEQGRAIAVDAWGNAYVTGSTASLDFPTANALQGKLGSGAAANVFVTKLSASGSALAYSTYLGGSGADYGKGIALDSEGDVYLTGVTDSTDFPVVSALQDHLSRQGSWNAFVTKLAASGSTLFFSTYLGGSNSSDGSWQGTWGQGIAVDSAGNAYLTGYTNSTDFPVSNAVQSSFAGGRFDAFAAKLKADGSGLAYATFLGGTGDDFGYGTALDSYGNAFVAGTTESSNFPTLYAIQPQRDNTANDAFVVRLDDPDATDFTLSISSPPVIQISPEQVLTLSGVVAASNGFSSPVTISCASDHQPLPATCNGTTVTPTPTGQPFTVTVSNPSPGSFSFYVRGMAPDGFFRQQMMSVQILACSAFARRFPPSRSSPLVEYCLSK